MVMKNQAEQLLTQAAGHLTSIDDLITIAEAASGGDGTDTNTYGCIDDDTTPQECLDQWTAEFQVTSPDCGFESQTVRHTENGVVKYGYVIYYGGCGDQSMDVWFRYGTNKWRKILKSSSPDATFNNGKKK